MGLGRGHFHGVYLLLCRNPKFRGRVYIGYTVNPRRRIQQHNAGRRRGGAWRTSGRGPWDMVLIVHGFPSEVAALKFEWSWQHPSRCRMLAGVTAKARGEGSFPYHLRLLWELLRCPRWGRFALTLRWIHQELRQDWPPDRAPLAHISLAFGEAMGEVTATGEATVTGATARAGGGCSVCGEVLTDRTAFLPCLHPRCTARSHIVCLARNFLQDEPEHLLPLEGPCPSCQQTVLWGNLIQFWRGVAGVRGSPSSPSSSQKGHWADLLNPEHNGE